MRLVADILQWGIYNFAYLPSVIELLFSDYAPIYTITWGLRAALSLFSITNDPSYYYLGVALFLLPQLPMLLEHVGIPVTRYVSNTLKKLTQLFILQSVVVNFAITPDPARLEEQTNALQAAELRVEKSRQRLLLVVNPVMGFFKSTNDHEPDSKREKDQVYGKGTKHFILAPVTPNKRSMLYSHLCLIMAMKSSNHLKLRGHEFVFKHRFGIRKSSLV